MTIFFFFLDFFETIISKTSAFRYLGCYLMGNKEVRDNVRCRISAENSAHFSLPFLIKTNTISCDSRGAIYKIIIWPKYCTGFKHGRFPRVLHKRLAAYREKYF
jgi:hypothetical protein